MPEKRKSRAPAASPKITSQSIIAEVIRINPAKVLPVFRKYRLYCPACRAAVSEPMIFVAQNYGLDVRKLIDELHKALAAR